MGGISVKSPRGTHNLVWQDVNRVVHNSLVRPVPLGTWWRDQESPRKKSFCRKLGIRSDHTRRRIEIKFCMG